MILSFEGKNPQIAADSFIAPNATLIGDVSLGSRANIWFGAVLRADWNFIQVGARSSIQDNVVLHVNARYGTRVGADVIVGHGVIMEGCDIGDACLIGMNATILSGAVVGPQSIVAAGTVIREGQVIPPRVLVAGVPAVVKRELPPEQYERVLHGIQNYQQAMEAYRGINHAR